MQDTDLIEPTLLVVSAFVGALLAGRTDDLKKLRTRIREWWTARKGKNDGDL